jgi:hypothetical protein
MIIDCFWGWVQRGNKKTAGGFTCGSAGFKSTNAAVRAGAGAKSKRNTRLRFDCSFARGGDSLSITVAGFGRASTGNEIAHPVLVPAAAN